MAIVIANLGRSSELPGKLRTLLSRLFGPLMRLLQLKKKKKSPTRGARSQSRSNDIIVSGSDQVDTVWSPERLNVMSLLWGEGCTSPYSAEFLRVSLPMLGLSEKKSLLQLGAGLGGIGRKMVEETGVWVTGLEADEELAGLGKDQTKMAGMQKRAPVTLANFEAVKLKENSFNTVISLESLYRVKDKEQLYTAMADALRVDGELLMTDFVLASDARGGDVVAQWGAREATPPHLWKAETIQAFLKTLNMDVRPFEDITARYRAGIFSGFFRYLSNVTKPELLEVSGDLIAECEYWAKQLSAIDSGDLKVFKFNAIKLPKKRKSMV